MERLCLFPRAAFFKGRGTREDSLVRRPGQHLLPHPTGLSAAPGVTLLVPWGLVTLLVPWGSVTLLVPWGGGSPY